MSLGGAFDKVLKQEPPLKEFMGAAKGKQVKPRNTLAVKPPPKPVPVKQTKPVRQVYDISIDDADGNIYDVEWEGEAPPTENQIRTLIAASRKANGVTRVSKGADPVDLPDFVPVKSQKGSVLTNRYSDVKPDPQGVAESIAAGRSIQELWDSYRGNGDSREREAAINELTKRLGNMAAPVFGAQAQIGAGFANQAASLPVEFQTLTDSERPITDQLGALANILGTMIPGADPTDAIAAGARGIKGMVSASKAAKVAKGLKSAPEFDLNPVTKFLNDVEASTRPADMSPKPGIGGQVGADPPPGSQPATTPKPSQPAGASQLGNPKFAKEGEPITMLLHHGSPDVRFAKSYDPTSGLAEFERPRPSFLVKDAKWLSDSWFTDDARIAGTYADDRRAFDYGNAEPGVLQRFVRLKNPKVVDMAGRKWQLGESTKAADVARAEGYDGVIFKNIVDPYSTLEGKGKAYQRPATTVVVFDPANISREAPTDPPKPGIGGQVGAPVKESLTTAQGARTMYREGSGAELLTNDFINPGSWWTDNPDLAIGQGANKGVIYEFEFSKDAKLVKGGKALPDGAGAEYQVGPGNQQGSSSGRPAGVLKSVTVKPGAQLPQDVALNLQRFSDPNNPNSVWVREDLPDGSTRYTPKAKEQGARTGDTGGALTKAEKHAILSRSDKELQEWYPDIREAASNGDAKSRAMMGLVETRLRGSKHSEDFVRSQIDGVPPSTPLEEALRLSIQNKIAETRMRDPLKADAMAAMYDPDFYTDGGAIRQTKPGSGSGNGGGNKPPTLQPGEEPIVPESRSALHFIKEVSMIARGLKLGADIGSLLRQGGEMLWNDPIQWAKSLKTAFTKADKAKLATYYTDILDREVNGTTVRELVNRHNLKTSVMEHEEGFAGKVFGKIPGVEKLENFQRAFLDSGRIERFVAFYKRFPDATEKELRQYAAYLNSSMGKSNADKVPELLEVVMTSPRWTRSRWEMAGRLFKSPATLVQALNGNKAAIQEVKNLGRYAAALYGVLEVAEANGAEVDFDPRSSDFLKVRVGEKVFDPTSGIASPIRASLRALLFLRGETDVNHNAAQELGRVLSYTASPLITSTWGAVTGKNLSGYDLDDEEKGAMLIAPLIASGTAETYKKEGVWAALGQGGLDFLGVGSNRYKKGDKSKWPKRKAPPTLIQKGLDYVPL